MIDSRQALVAERANLARTLRWRRTVALASTEEAVASIAVAAVSVAVVAFIPLLTRGACHPVAVVLSGINF